MRPSPRLDHSSRAAPPRRRCAARRAWLLAALLAGGAGGATAQEDYEQPVYVPLDEVLPESLISSGAYRVTGVRRVPGPFLAFAIESEAAGSQEVESIPLTLVRIQEVQIVTQALNQFRNDTRERADEERGQIRIGADSVGDILGSPLDTSSAVVGQFGRNVGQTFEEFGEFPGPQDAPIDSGASRQVVDPIFESRRRSVASQLGLDVYSSNPSVQRLLTVIARARAGGQPRAGITTVSITRPPEVTVGGGAVQERIRSAVLNQERGSLFERNAERLEAAGVATENVRRLLDHPVLSPTHKAAITEYVAFMEGVANRGAVVTAALDARDEVDALGKVQIARMFAWYHESADPLREFIDAGHLPVAISKSGGLVLALPFDVLEWSAESARVFSALADFADRKNARSRTVVVNGVVTERALSELAQRAFNVRQRFLFRL